jgi:HEAT repeat protein
MKKLLFLILLVALGLAGYWFTLSHEVIWCYQLASSDWEVRYKAVRAMHSLAERYHSCDLDRAGGLTEQRRMAAKSEFPEIKRRAERAIPLVLTALHDEARAVRHLAAQTIELMPLRADLSIPALITVLRTDTDNGVRIQAMFALREYGEDAVTALPAFLTLLRDKNAKIRSNSAYVLSQLAINDERTIPPLLELLDDPSSSVRISAGVALSKRGTRARAAVPVFLRQLKDPDPELRAAAADFLGSLQPESEDALRQLRDAAENDTDPSVRKKAKETIKLLETLSNRLTK